MKNLLFAISSSMISRLLFLLLSSLGAKKNESVHHWNERATKANATSYMGLALLFPTTKMEGAHKLGIKVAC